MEKLDKATVQYKANMDIKSNKLKTAPPVRQTLTSYKRMLKANPLLKYQEAGIDIDQLVGLKSQGTSLKEGTVSAVSNSKVSSSLECKASGREFKKPELKPLKRTQSLKLPKSGGFNLYVGKPTSISGNLLTNNHFKKPTSGKSKSENLSKNSNKIELRKPIESKIKVRSLPKHIVSLKCKADITNNATVKTDNTYKEPKPENKIPTLRRSFSSGDLKNDVNPKTVNTRLGNLQSRNKNVHSSPNFSPDISPITDEDIDTKNFIFKSPSAYERRSICSFTPYSAKKDSLFETSTPATVEMQHLEKRLIKWLISRRKSLSCFKHLRSFDKNCRSDKYSFSILINEENKENVKVDEKSESQENPQIITTPEPNKLDTPIANITCKDELPKVAKSAMVELQDLIKEDYPRALCLGWLELIAEKYQKAHEEPEYWECRAAIEQCAGNVGNAVEFYKTAIIQGAEVSAVDKSLDQLLKKFSLLNISPCESKQNKIGDKERIFREARTVFKATIIQCAVQERKLKK